MQCPLGFVASGLHPAKNHKQRNKKTKTTTITKKKVSGDLLTYNHVHAPIPCCPFISVPDISYFDGMPYACYSLLQMNLIGVRVFYA